MITLIAKKRIAFRNPESGEFLPVEPQVLCQLPDWIRKDPMYKWSLDSGVITVVEKPTIVEKAPAATAKKGAKK